MAEGQIQTEVKNAPIKRTEVSVTAPEKRGLQVIIDKARSPLDTLKNIAGARVRTVSEGYVESETRVSEIESIVDALRSIKSFTTEKGSVYSYDDNLQTSRLKVETGEQFGTQDLTVFANLSLQEAEEVVRATRADSSRRVVVVEEQPDSIPKMIRAIEDVTDPKTLRFGFIDGGILHFGKHVSLMPSVGADAFDTSQSMRDDGKTYLEGHLGHKVVGIDRKG